ncbi:peroxidase 31-like [Vigna umbellata]|uniref:peroxidase 31-like n=1 Tax=Vigna umbellata TaxID=87088 RepID=UPI001F5FBE1C|nr:peroxidase 31-like [Vigna umbellata]
MVVLSCAHFGFSKTSETDLAYNPEYVAGLRKLWENYMKDPTMAAYSDVLTPMKFDKMYFNGLMATDTALFIDPRTKPFVDTYIDDEGDFFQDFARAIEKLKAWTLKLEQRA